jgi:ComF family protein
MRLPFPAWCYSCGAYIGTERLSASGFLCLDCYQDLPAFEASVCLKCGKHHKQSICNIEWAEAISGFDALFPFKEPVRKWVSRLKYSRNLVVGRLLQGLIKTWMVEHGEELKGTDFLIPVPLHFSRLNRRGLNQSAYLLNRQKNFPVKNGWVRKSRGTEQQAGKTKKEREANLKGVFRVSNEVKGKNLLLFDDVCTTGETLSEISKALKSAGANQVNALVLCRNI